MNDNPQNHKPSISALGTGHYSDNLAADATPLGDLLPGKRAAGNTATKGILASGKKEVIFHKSHLSQKSGMAEQEKAKPSHKPDGYSGVAGNKVLPLTRQSVFTNPTNRIEMSDSGPGSPNDQDSELRVQKTILAAGPTKVSRLWRKVQSSRKKLLMMDKMAEEMDHIQFQGSSYSRKPVIECSIRHDSKTHEWLQVVRSASLLFILIIVPLQFAFPASNKGIHSVAFKVLLGLIDITHFVRTVLDACFISYQADSGYVVTDDVEIFKKFRR